MAIWLLFLFICYLLIGLYQHKRKNLFFLLLLAVVIYFATFRDGLGSDYTAYQSYCEREVFYSNAWFLIEPIPAFLYKICYDTNLSAVLFFFVSSCIIYISCFKVYSKNINFGIAAFVFLTYTNLFLSSLNVVRQFMAASIVLVGVYCFIIKKKSPWYFATVLLAFMIHKSVVLFIPMYWIKKDDFNPVVWIGILIGSMVLPMDWIFASTNLNDFLTLLDYDSLLKYKEVAYSKFSMSNIYLHVITLIFLFNRKRIRALTGGGNFCIFALKMTVFGLICNNLSAGALPIAYRYSMMFSVFLPLLFAYLPKVIEGGIARLITYVPIFVLLMTLLYLRSDDRVYCPQRLLPIESIYDAKYHPYENPDVIIQR